MATTTTTTTTTMPATAVTTARVRRWRGHFGAWRALAGLPAVAGGVLLMAVLTAGLTTWQTPVLLLWLSGAGIVCTRFGERLAVRKQGFRRPTAQQRQVLAPVWAAALRRGTVPAAQVDWYLRAGRQPNACVAGRRSVAVTHGALQAFMAGRLGHDEFVSVLLHELGHLDTQASTFGLVTGWLVAPGRLGCRAVFAVAVRLSGHSRLGWGSRLLALSVGAIAVFRAEQHHQWAAVLMLTGLAGAMVVTPLADAAISRAAERAADRYARDLGAGPDLARALVVISGPAGPRRGPATRLLDRHPSVASRVEFLTHSGGSIAVVVGDPP